MSHEITLHYDESLLRRAAFQIWRRQIGVGFIITLVVLAVGLVTMIANGDTSWLVGAAGTTLGMGILVRIALYVVHYRRALQRLKMMGKPEATLILSESSFTISSEIGSSTLPWSAISEIWRFPDFWLLFVSRSSFSTLPLADFSAEAKAFFIERVRAAGGKVRPGGA
jgi:YcxB-like protein